MRRKTIYLMSVALIAMAAMGLWLVQDSNPVSAQRSAGDESSVPTKKMARADMLSIALDLRSASEYSVYAEKGIKNNGSRIKGEAGDALRGGDSAETTRGDLTKAFSAINQLPCQEAGANLRGGSFEPGVYCVSGADLRSTLTLDARSNPNAVFLFRVGGTMRAGAGFELALQNDAQAGNVYFVSDDAIVEENTNFRGNILTAKDITIKSGATVTGKTISLDGTVTATEASLAPAAPGVLQICKFEREYGDAPGLADRIFRFRIGANIYEVPVGQCSGPITLEEGNYTIEELLDGRRLNGTAWSGRFRLVDVNSPTPGALGAVNLPLRTANVFVRAGDISNQTVVNFVNAFAISAVIEICKRAVADQTTPFSIQDRDVSGFFDYTVDANANTLYTVPVGQCSGPIQVNPPTTPQPVPGRGLVLVTELEEAGFTLESVSTFPADRLQNFVPNFGIRNTTACSNIGPGLIPPACIFANPRGGYADILVIEGGTSNQTTVNFFNRTNPGRIKVCKIAGPGIPEGTRFEFEVTGWAPRYEGTPAPANPTAILPGVAVTRRVVVVAGPASQGGFCNFVEGTFIIGSIVNVTELLPPLDPVPGLGPINGVPGDIRVSRIRVSAPSAIISGSLAGRTVSFRARREVVEAEFTNYVFRPTLLKICKIAGPGVAVGTPFNFTVTTDTVGGLFNEGTQTVTVQAGPAAQGGFCQFVNGPYDPTNTTPPIGTYRVGATVEVRETPVTGTVVSSITSPTGTPLPCSPIAPNCARLVLGFPGGFNELAFTNAASVGTLTQRAPFDFDGDNKSDASIYRNGTWTWTRSSNGAQQSVDFGLATDVTAPADFDGDNKTDVAVFRDGTWHILQSSNGQYKGVQFGQAGDIAQPGDFDGDGSADVAVFRPSTGAWYINRSRDGFFGMQFGIATDRAAAGDYDGDGATDIAVYRPADGAWYIMQSRDGFKAVQFGIASDRIVAADYDGDGRTDPAVYRNGAWYMLRSTAGFGYVQFGVAADRPVPGDYNGDGKADVGVYRDGTWHIMLSGASEATYTSMVLGGGSDSPVPSSYVR